MFALLSLLRVNLGSSGLNSGLYGESWQAEPAASSAPLSIDGLLHFEPMDNLPTASPIGFTGVDDAGDEPQATHNSFLHSLKWFMKRSKSSDDFAEDQITVDVQPTDVTSDIPGDIAEEVEAQLETAGFASNMDEVMLVDGEIDPIYETYVKYTHYTREYADLDNGDDCNAGTDAVPKATPITGDVDDGTSGEDKKGAILDDDIEGSKLLTQFTLTRLASETRVILSQMTLHRDNGGRRTEPRKKEKAIVTMTRKLSSISLRGQASKTRSWNWSGKKGIDDDGEEALVSLFDEPEFQERLNLGSVSKRGACTDENYDQDIIPDHAAFVEEQETELGKERKVKTWGKGVHLTLWTQKTFKRAHSLRLKARKAARAFYE